MITLDDKDAATVATAFDRWCRVEGIKGARECIPVLMRIEEQQKTNLIRQQKEQAKAAKAPGAKKRNANGKGTGDAIRT